LENEFVGQPQPPWLWLAICFTFTNEKEGKLSAKTKLNVYSARTKISKIFRDSTANSKLHLFFLKKIDIN